MPKTKKVPTTTIQIRSDLYEKWADHCKREGKYIKEMTEKLITDYLAGKKMDLVEQRADDVLVTRLRRFEDRIAAMYGKQGMDIAMTLMATLTLLSRDLNRNSERSVDIETLLQKLRPMAAQHFSKKKATENNEEAAE